MTSKLISIAVCLALQACAMAPQGAPAGELIRQANDWDAAIVHKDMAAVAANMAPDYRHIRDSSVQITPIAE